MQSFTDKEIELQERVWELEECLNTILQYIDDGCSTDLMRDTIVSYLEGE